MALKRHLKPFYLGLIALLLLIIFSRIQFELLWFSQFDYQLTIIKRWLIQSLFLILSAFIGFLFYRWTIDWISLNKKKDELSSHNSIKGYKYLAIIVISYLFLNLSLFSILNVSFISFKDPYQLNSISSILVNNLSEHYFTFLLFTSPSLFLLKNIKFIKLYQLIFNLLFSFSFIRSWSLWTLAIAIPKYGITDPILKSDISFSLSQYPALTFLILLFILISLYTISISVYYYSVSLRRFSDWILPPFSIIQERKLSKLSSFLFLNISLLIWISRYNLLWNSNNFFPGAGWLDVNFNLPVRTITSLVCFSISIFLLLRSKFTRHLIVESLFFIFISLLFISELTISPILHWILVRPRELNLEYKYIETAIKSTRKAFQLDSIKTKLINPNPQLTQKDLELGKSTLKNIRLWDSQPLLATNKQLQQLRLYYSFFNASVDRYSLNSSDNERQQVIISAREIDQTSLPNNSKSWLNKHFVYTHGYGFTMSPVNTRASDGLPEYFISDLGKATKISGSKILGISSEQISNSIPIGNAALYFGTFNLPYAVAPTELEELDYPEGDQNIFNHYSGTGGIPLSNLYQRIISAINLKEPRLLNTGILNNSSRLLVRREVKKRVKNIAPFINLIGDPYLVSVRINDNKDYSNNQYQYWIIDGYTFSRTYPYSASTNGNLEARYLRNSVKIIVDAYNGGVHFYINELNDPIIKAWKRIFPELFKNINQMPKNLRDHMMVPTDMFNYQVNQLLKFHVTDVRTFYNGEDIWQVPKELYGKEQIPVQPYHITAQLLSDSKSEFLLLQPFSPLARPNLSGWLTARSDNENYGELVLLRFPSETTIFGPEQIQALINQDPDISQQFSLWDRAGSEVIQGNLLVIPLGRSLLYVEPVYLQATTGGLPTLTRVVVSDGKRIAMEADLQSAILKLLNKAK